MKRSYFLTLLICFCFLQCNTSFDDETEGQKWDGEGTPTWLDQKVKEIAFKEQGVSSYLLCLSYRVYKFENNDSHCIAIQYVSYAGEVKRVSLYYSNTGKTLSENKIKSAYEQTKQLIYTNQVGGKDGYIPEIGDIPTSKIKNPQWLQTEIDKLCNTIDNTGETLFQINIESFEYQSNTYVKFDIGYATKEDKMSWRTSYYTAMGEDIKENSALFNKLSKFTQSIQFNSIHLWKLYVSYFSVS